MLRLMGVERGAKVLDAGCGPGVHSVRVARAGCQVCAVDITDHVAGSAGADRGRPGFLHHRIPGRSMTRLSFRTLLSATCFPGA